MNEDNDIKIYVGKNKADHVEFDAISQGIKMQIANGNSEKARSIGELFAQIKPDDDFQKQFNYDFSASVLYQIRVLMTFTCVYAVKMTIANEFISNTITSAMYEYLKKNENGYFRNISDGSAFTFYRLAVNKEGNVEENIGKEFAKRCSMNNAEVEKLGADIFKIKFDEFTQSLLSADFKE